MISNDQWTRYLYTIEISEKSKKVKNIDFDLIVQDMYGNVHITDMQLQEGKSVSSHMPHTSEILAPVTFNIDENAFMNTITEGTVYKAGDAQPTIHQNVKNRFYNIVGRGHSVIAIPNVFPEDYTFPLVTSALDLTLYAKEDFDFLRIRTHDGGLIPGRLYPEDGPLANHPLNYQYTREFFFDGAKADEPIELKTTIRKAALNNEAVSLKRGSIYIDSNTSIPVDRQRFMLAPAGSFRIGIEFYKKETETFTLEDKSEVTLEYLKDVGIGFYGLAELNQWTYGVSKL